MFMFFFLMLGTIAGHS